jgi:Apea-like HEPN
MGLRNKLELDVRDFWRISNGLEIYAGLDTKATMDRLREHKEDGLCTITPASGAGELFCTRDGYQAIFDLAERHVSSLPVPDDHSSDEIAQQIRRYIAQAMIEQKADEPALAWVLAKAVSEVETGHIARTYHFPCVLVACRKPPKFEIGPVTFTTAEQFPKSMADTFSKYCDSRSDRPERLEGFKKHVAEYGWVATVTIPPCAEERGRQRAELVISTAINLLRALLGNHYARDIRIAHAPQSKPAHTEHACEERGELHLNFSRSAPGVLADDDWLAYVQRHKDFWNRSAHLLNAAVLGKKSEIARRLIDALGWFGEAAFELPPGTQIVKYVLALERLSTTEIFRPHTFCQRVGLMSAQNDSEFEQCYWDAYTAYSARSLVVHGGVSAKSGGQGKNLRLAHEITRKALFRGLGIHCSLDDHGKCSTLPDLRKFFQKWESPRAALLAKLHDELHVRMKADRKLLFQ